ncbi:putative Na+/H+ antiporter [Tahibacter amnicola]|uniref:Na+/H+ antiporter n=1 Tax=Tahibacter amnicola TaxID=2976241 RepID=A0ABY6BKF0_9GAMM|nr:putative Na+/H+ antiporter [Tahibacter amnicola]UXI70379.1 putative Na+/H+ antiporter [Tahibacter amnicola]
MSPSRVEWIAALLFALALLHTFSTKAFQALAHRGRRHAGMWHLLGEVEVVFGFWAIVLLLVMAFFQGSKAAVDYAESRQYTEPLFVFVIMVVAASRPVIAFVQSLVEKLARLAPVRDGIAQLWLALTLVPLAGSLITEPAAMTLAAMILVPLIFRADIPERPKYAVLGVLFVNVSIGGTLTSYAAPPVLMVASAWQWDTAFMARTFGWKAAVAVLINATLVTGFVRRHLRDSTEQPVESSAPVPLTVSLIHLAFLAAIVAFAHHPVIFVWVFLSFLGYAQAYERHQSPLILKESLLVGFFLAGLVVLGGMQQWWLQPIVSSLSPLLLFFGALGLTAMTDNAALTYLGSLISTITEPAKYMLVAGAVAGGGLTIIANAPNPAGVALVRRGFADESVGALELLLGALPPTAVAALLFLL